MIELNDVTKVYNQGRANEVAAIRGVSLTIKAREVTVLKGPSGSGKTTLLTLIGCLARPTSGRVRLGGEAVSSLPEKFLAELRRQTFGFVFQQHNLIRGVSALQNVMLPGYPMGVPHARLALKALELLAELGLEHRAGLTAEHLSGGEAQRVAIARALINGPEVIVADEPTANLDTALTRQFLEIAGRLKSEGKTLLMTSHDPRIWRSPVVDNVITMADGREAAA